MVQFIGACTRPPSLYIVTGKLLWVSKCVLKNKSSNLLLIEFEFDLCFEFLSISFLWVIINPIVIFFLFVVRIYVWWKCV